MIFLHHLPSINKNIQTSLTNRPLTIKLIMRLKAQKWISKGNNKIKEKLQLFF